MFVEVGDCDFFFRLNISGSVDGECVQILVEVSLGVRNTRVIQARNLREERLGLVANVEVVVPKDIENGVIRHCVLWSRLASPY